MTQKILVTVDLGKLCVVGVCGTEAPVLPCAMHGERIQRGAYHVTEVVGTARWVGVGGSGTMAQAGRDRMVCPDTALGPRRTLPTRSLDVDKRGDYPNLEDFQCYRREQNLLHTGSSAPPSLSCIPS